LEEGEIKQEKRDPQCDFAPDIDNLAKNMVKRIHSMETATKKRKRGESSSSVGKDEREAAGDKEERRLLAVACLSIAWKYYSQRSPPMTYFAKIYKLDTQSLIKREIDVLGKLDWDVGGMAA
jgi:hypothetical protein